MALVIDGSDVAVSTPISAAGPTEVVASGNFGGNTVQISVAASLGEYAPVHTFFAPGAISLSAAAGTLIKAEIIGGSASSIDVAMNP